MREHLLPLSDTETFFFFSFEKLTLVVRASGKALLTLWVVNSLEVPGKDGPGGRRLFSRYAFRASKRALQHADARRCRIQSIYMIIGTSTILK